MFKKRNSTARIDRQFFAVHNAAAHHHTVGKTADRPTLFGKIKSLPAYHVILIAFGFVLLCHASYIPIWLTVLGMICIVLQIPIIRQKVGQKFGLQKIYKILQIATFGLGIIGIWLSFGQIFGADVSICFLILCAICKLWELFNRRDGYVMLNLSLFILAAAFLWTQSLLLSVAVFVGLLLVLFGFVALSDDGTDGTGRIKSLCLISLPAIPLLIVLFIFFPRIPPLWSVPIAGKQATTGVSNSMSPGDFSNLSKSTELAFRVEFSQAIPHRHQLYWRGLVFSHFDGITWRESDISEDFWRSIDSNTPTWATALSTPTNNQYKVILEPTNQNWLFALEYSRPLPLYGVGITQEYNIRSYRPITSQFHYTNHYYPNATLGTTLSELDKQVNLQLPKTGNEQARQFAKQLYQKSQGDSTLMIQNIHQYIVDQQFGYTLSPPTLGQNRIDDFLFNSRLGFCEHYASSFVFLMRAAGIPARVVAGYQGGELGRDGQSWEVRQMDAHAWAEVWINQQGWTRVDPTAFVSPERIDDGMNALTQSVGSEIFGSGVVAQIGYQQFRFLNTIRQYSDQMSYYWQKDVVGFDSDNQKNSLLAWFNITTIARQLIYLMATFGGIMAAFMLWYWHKNRKIYHVLDLPIVQLSNALKHSPHLQKSTGETPLSYLARLGEYAKNQKPNQADQINGLIHQLCSYYRHHRYDKPADESTNNQSNKTHKQFKQNIKQLIGLINGHS